MKTHQRSAPLFAISLLLVPILLNACQPAQALVVATQAATPTIGSMLSPSQAPSLPRPTHTPIPSPTAAPSRVVTLMAVGDIMLGRTIGDMITENSIEAPFEFTADRLTTADVTLGNLECPISTQGEPASKTYAFRAPLAAAESLSFGGFDLVSLANNHILDYGALALADTLQALEAAGVRTVGAGMNATEAYQPVFMEVNGLRLAFLAFTDVPNLDFDYLSWEAGADQPGIAWAHPERISAGVQAAKAEADLVIVLFHNGHEIVQKVSPDQQAVARLAIDSGATLVIGSHPHVLQRIEPYQEGLIVYSMGNFVFDNFLFPPNYSAILSVVLTPEGVSQYKLIDVVVQLNGVPQIMPYDLDE